MTTISARELALNFDRVGTTADGVGIYAPKEQTFECDHCGVDSPDVYACNADGCCYCLECHTCDEDCD